MPLDNLSELKRRVPGGKYTLARAIAERARQLQSGQVIPLVEVRTPNPLSVAIDEIVQAKISFRFGDDVKTEEESQETAAEAVEDVLPLSPDDAPPVKVKKERAPRKAAAPKETTIEVEAPAAETVADEAAADEAPAAETVADEAPAQSA